MNYVFERKNVNKDGYHMETKIVNNSKTTCQRENVIDRKRLRINFTYESIFKNTKILYIFFNPGPINIIYIYNN